MQQEVVKAIRDAISSGQYSPGDRLIEQELSEQLGVSRAPVREALRQLVGEGLVEAETHRGTTVVSVTTADLEEIARLRAALEPVAIERLIELGDPQHLVILRGIVSEIRAALPRRDPVLISHLDMRFHETMCELSGYPRLLSAWRVLGIQLRSYFAVAQYFFDDESIAGNHERLIDVIERGDVSAAREELYEHIVGPEGWQLYRHGGAPEAQQEPAPSDTHEKD
ncbi:GntR family transcriptional regulator [Microbacterium ulmi]|nr:GntR family transcriptional regulator [Microbacterium ulmi]